MAGIQLTGLATGLDWKSLVDQLISVSGAPKKAMLSEQATNNTRASALNDVKSQLSSFQAMLASDFTSTSFQQRLAAPEDSTSTWKASSSSGGDTGSFQFSVTALATAAKRVGASDVTGGLNATSDVSGLLISSMSTAQTVTAGQFTVNGSRISVATTDTLKDVFDRITAATGVAAAYDPVTDKVTFSGSGEVKLGSSADTSNFLSALKLFQNGTSSVASEGALGASKLSVPLASSGLRTALTAVDGSGNGSFTINGTQISYNVNSDSIQSVLSRINSSAAGVTAAYDSAADRFTLTNSKTGNLNIFAEETGTGFLTSTGLIGTGSSLQSGNNASFSVNGGGAISSLSNTLDSSVTGISGLSLTVDSTGTQTIKVSSDIQGATTKINSLISKYNAIQSSIESYSKITVNGTKVTTGPLAGNSDVQAISSKLRSIVFGAGSSLTGDVKRLSDLGVDFSSTDSSLAVRNSTTLNSMLTDSGADVGSYFTDSSSGLVKRLNDFLTTQVASTGSLATQSTNITKQNDSLDKQMAALDLQLASERSILEASFIAMENASSMYQSQAAQLANAFKQ